MLGREAAHAAAAERRHRAAHRGQPSPLADITYDRSELSLMRFVPARTDERVRVLLDRSGDAGAHDREGVRAALTDDDFYTLLMFARRSVVRALRADGPVALSEAVEAMTLIDLERVDPRDVHWATALLSWAMLQVGVDPLAALGSGAERAERGVAEVFARFARHPTSDLRDWGYEPMSTAEGPALVNAQTHAFAPEADLLTAGLVLVASLEQDRYRNGELTVATQIPDVWLRPPGGESPSQALTQVRATVSVRADLDPAAYAKADSQMLLAFIAECADDEAATAIAASAVPRKTFEALGAANGRLCAVIVGSSFVKGVRPFERGGSLQRFESALREALAAA